MSAPPRPRSAPPSRLLGTTAPRVWTPPLRELTPETTLGFECINFAQDILEIDLMPWQRWFLKAALELHPTEVDSAGDPLFRFRKVFLLVGRQNGKSTVMQALTLWRMFVDRCNLVIGTAQDLEIAETLLKECYELAEEVDELKSEMGPLMRGAGKFSFRLKSGETYKVKAASRRGGRGLSGELVLLDELREHQSWDAWGAVTKTTNARDRAQVYGVSNAGDVSSVVLRHFRKKAHERLGDPDGLNADPAAEELVSEDQAEDMDVEVDDSLGWFEWSAAQGCQKFDRDGWAQANPALGYRIRESTIRSDAHNDPEWTFRTEVLCQWSEGTLHGPFEAGSWDATRDPESRVAPETPVTLGVDVSWNRGTSHIAIAGRRTDGSMHGEVVATRAGTDWLIPWLTSDERQERVRKARVVVQGKGAPVSSLIDAMREAGVNVEECAGSDLSAACGSVYDLVRDGLVKHPPWPALDVAAATAVPKMLEGGAFVFDRKKSPADAAPLIAFTLAVASAVHATEPDYDLLASVY